MRDAVLHLASLGHTRIGFINGGMIYAYAAFRRVGFDQGMSDAGLAIDDELIVENAVTMSEGASAADAILDLPNAPTAIVCAVDFAALGVYRAAEARGLAIGKDLSVVAYDGVHEGAQEDLSGGQRQRVAIGRSIVRDPTAFLFDEPLSNLDAALRVEMRYEIAKLHQTLKSTMIYVTHDQVEAMTLADRIVVLEFGKIAQVGSPRELYERPANLFVAQFIGSPRMNVFSVGAAPEVPMPKETVSVGVRPEHIELVETGSGQIQGTVDVLEYLGADTYVIMSCGEAGQITVRVNGNTLYRPGEKAELAFATDHIHGFDIEGLAVPLV